MRVAVLAHGKFPDRAKTAVGVLRYADYDVVSVIDRDHAGSRVTDHVPGVQDAPVVAGFGEVPEPVDALLIGIAPIGGGFDESWRPDVLAALSRGCDVIAGLHYFLNDDEEFVSLAAENDCELRDVRRPPDDLSVSEGLAGAVDAEVILTVGTDCSVGKMTTTMELARAAKAAGHEAAVIPTGQTGIMIEGWGTPIDRVVSDFTAGAVEAMIRKKGDDYEYLFVEGQGSIVHPAYSAVTCGILHGAMPDALVLCHEADRDRIHGYEPFPLPSIEEYVDLYEGLAAPVSDASVVAGALNTSDLGDAAARDALVDFESAIDAPATDVLRYDIDDVLEAIV
ncbi:DUF1611 domain-containing protein [Natranaeroarchaeum aerophilus]|uniref:DUF1611 domain-containing protein n=1 Tax=Natranaeroarchaeum aerophilus TaxID=2917711 RepID=A0AAE3FP83_9EURY|nr:DUF1611 domain-containing protein [Natranaeroarchaeum aerophilus]MCL9812626.1 DUF1611 domain-containing protein [Natranaeroarchaeum aerophilus]